ncbi:MAG: hypothetical protein AABY22_22360 [Nanoarchaeota archaeon]
MEEEIKLVGGLVIITFGITFLCFIYIAVKLSDIDEYIVKLLTNRKKK